MELLKRHASLTVLATVLFVQIVALAYQVKRPGERGSVRLIRVWGISLVTPAENAIEHGQEWAHYTWRNYFYLRDVRRENDRLQEENMRLRLEQVRMLQDAGQAQRLQALFKFKEQFISQTVAAQVIGSSGSELSRVLYIDKGSNDGISSDMAVVTPSGVVGKVWRVFPNSAQVLEINDQTSGVGAILEKSRLQGILKGVPAGDGFPVLHYIMGDEKIEIGETVVTSGGDRIFPKGLPIGQVVGVSPGTDTFLRIRVKPSAQLDRVEEVLVITKIVEKDRDMIPEMPMRASDILAQRLPSYSPKPPEDAAAAQAAGSGAATGGAAPASGAPAATGAKPNATGTSPSTAKPAGTKPAGTNSAAGGGVKPAVTTATTPAKKSATGAATTQSATPQATVKPNASATAPKPAATGAKPAGDQAKPKASKPATAGQATTTQSENRTKGNTQ